MKKFIVEYRENENKRPLVELKDFIFIGQYEAESAQEAALQAAGRTIKRKFARNAARRKPWKHLKNIRMKTNGKGISN